MKFEKKILLSESLDDLLNFEDKTVGTAPVVFQDAVENMKKARELADERLAEQNKAVEKPVDGTAKGGETTVKSRPEAKKLYLSESIFDDFDDIDDDREVEEEWYDMYTFIMDSFTETGTDYKKYKLPRAVERELAVSCTAPDNSDNAANHFPIGTDADDNIIVQCSNVEILNAYIKCAEAYALDYKYVDNKKPGEYNNFTFKVAVPKDSIGQIYCVGDYFRDKNIPLESVLGFMDNKMKTSFAMYLAKKGELFANPDDNEKFVEENKPVRQRRAKNEPTEVEQEVAATDATEPTEEPVEEPITEGKEKLSDRLRAALLKKHSVTEDVDARPNSTRLLSMMDDGVVSAQSLAEELVAWLSDNEVGEFAKVYEYFPNNDENKGEKAPIDYTEILGWLSEHEQAYEDAEMFFSAKGLTLEDVPVDDLLSWMQEHDQLWSDFCDKFGNPLNESVEQKPLVEGKKCSFTIDGKEYKGVCVGTSTTDPNMCDVRIGSEYYDGEEVIDLRKGIYNPHEDREIKDGKFFIPKSELKECDLTEELNESRFVLYVNLTDGESLPLEDYADVIPEDMGTEFSEEEFAKDQAVRLHNHLENSNAIPNFRSVSVVLVDWDEDHNNVKSESVFETKSELDEAYVKVTLSSFQPWEGAVDTLRMIKEAGKFDSFEAMIDEMYPEGIEKSSLNDLLWFEKEWVLSMLQIPFESEDDEEETM